MCIDIGTAGKDSKQYFIAVVLAVIMNKMQVTRYLPPHLIWKK